MKTLFTLEHVANMVFVVNGEQIWKAWNEEEFTERKLNNFLKKLEKNFLNGIELERKGF